MYYNQRIANEKLLLRKFMTHSEDTELGRGGIGASSQVPPTPGPGLLKQPAGKPEPENCEWKGKLP